VGDVLVAESVQPEGDHLALLGGEAGLPAFHLLGVAGQGARARAAVLDLPYARAASAGQPVEGVLVALDAGEAAAYEGVADGEAGLVARLVPPTVPLPVIPGENEGDRGEFLVADSCVDDAAEGGVDLLEQGTISGGYLPALPTAGRKLAGATGMAHDNGTCWCRKTGLLSQDLDGRSGINSLCVGCATGGPLQSLFDHQAFRPAESSHS
jgi:hypothetical protein